MIVNNPLPVYVYQQYMGNKDINTLVTEINNQINDNAWTRLKNSSIYDWKAMTGNDLDKVINYLFGLKRHGLIDPIFMAYVDWHLIGNNNGFFSIPALRQKIMRFCRIVNNDIDITYTSHDITITLPLLNSRCVALKRLIDNNLIAMPLVAKKIIIVLA